MKDQYFGDVNDFRKYGLLRVLTRGSNLSLGICWMKTSPDERSDGNNLGYLDHPDKYKDFDPDLFDWLNNVVGNEKKKDRRTIRIESTKLLGSPVFQSDYLTDKKNEQNDYFNKCAEFFAKCDLIFFDPDNGLEVKSRPRGRKDSCKYLYWQDLTRFYSLGASILIYQHFIRENRDGFISRIAKELCQRLDLSTVVSFRTPNVVFFLAPQNKHNDFFSSRLENLRSGWKQSRITATKHFRQILLFESVRIFG